MSRDLSSAEAVSKYLRSKDSLDLILDAAEGIIGNTLSDVFLPNAEMFVFELICDRMNANSPPVFKAWKYSPRVWRLWIQAWKVLENTKNGRGRAFETVKFVDVLINVFNCDNLELWNTVFGFMTLIKDQVYIDIDENSVLNLLKAYTANAMDGAQHEKWAATIKYMLDLQSLKVTNSFGKKHYSKLILENVPSLLNYYSKAPNVISQIFSKYVFTEELAQKYYITNVKQLLSQNILPEEVKLLFTLTVDEFASTHINICEQLFIAIVAEQKYTSISEDLLSILSTHLHNKSLSSEFLKSIYSTEFDLKTANINWLLMEHLLNLDVELAIEYGPRIFLTLTAKVTNAPQIGQCILHAYLKGREFHEFFTVVWIDAIKKDPLWESTDYIKLVSNSISSLSSNQLINLLRSVFEVEYRVQKPLLSAIFRGMNSCGDSKVQATTTVTKEKLHTFIERSTEQGEYPWEVYYYALCAYGEELVDILKDIITGKVKKRTEFYYNSVFRYIELTKECPQQIEEKFVRGLNLTEEVQFVLNRWLVILEHYFSEKSHREFIDIALHKTDFKGLELFFELPKLTSALNVHILEHVGECLTLIPFIPVQCFSKHAKRELISKLLSLCSESADYDSRRCLQHVLSETLNADFRALLDVVGTANEQSKEISIRIFEKAWFNAYSHKDDRLNPVIDDFTQAFTFKQLSTLTPKLEVGLHLLKAAKATKLGGVLAWETALSSSAVGALTKLGKDSNIEMVTWIFEALSVVFESVDKKSLGDQIKKFGATQAVHDAKLTRVLFVLLSKLYIEDSPRYVIALWYILETVQEIDVTNELLQCLETCCTEVWRDICVLVLESANPVCESGNASAFSKMITSLVSSIKQDNKDMFVHLHSALLTHLEMFGYDEIEAIIEILSVSLSEKPWLFNQYLTEQTLTLVTKLTYNSVEVYNNATHLMGRVLFVRRNKLTARHHIVIRAFIALLEPLSLKSKTPICNSAAAGASYSRLLTNLCNPAQKEVSRTSLNSVSTLAKNALRRHLPMLMVNYVFYALRFNFENVVADELREGIFSMFAVLSQKELQLVSSSLDIPGKTYFKTLYGNFKEHGKWKDA